MTQCEICGEATKELCKCKECGTLFCDICGDAEQELCEFCMEEEW